MARRTAKTANGAEALLVQGRAEHKRQLARVEALIGEAAALRRRIARDFWDLGRILVTLREAQAHVALGFSRFDQLVSERIGVAPATAFKLMAVAERMPREEAMAIGQEKAYAVLTYVDAAGDAGAPADLVRTDARVGDKPLSQATVREIVSAAAAVRPTRPRSLAVQQRDKEDREAAAALVRHLGLPRGVARSEGDHFVIRLTRRQVARLLRG